jgi:pimeloyl-ACP methyl ester carboxylesterase
MSATRTASVVTLHASASSARQWQPLAAALAPRFRVHAIDLHGHGERSPWRGARALSLADEAALVAPVLSREGDVHLVGHSYGGAVALKVASMYPQHVRSVTVYEPVMFRWLVGGAGDGSRRRPRRRRHDPSSPWRSGRPSTRRAPSSTFGRAKARGSRWRSRDASPSRRACGRWRRISRALLLEPLALARGRTACASRPWCSRARAPCA